MDLFELLTLLLLLLNLVALLGALSILNGIKRELASRPDAASAVSLGVAPEQSYAQPSAYESPYTGRESAYTGAATEQRQTEQRQEVSTGFVPLSEAAPAGGERTAGSQAPAQSGVPALRGDEPEEQPFERDGRWWFKRGGELLVYDEGTGQWVNPAQGGGAAPATSTASSFGSTSVATATPDTGEGWRCASCGAVNGSTATTCRMCFSPR